ncbi:hypothetical protein GLOTRDRAFT_111952 [Gloeophyllum trabeum ATCC 11539]|uniref:Cytochrome c oxidase subunit 8, mitochondrial n=1 Tax=Gloeophyllum trabeum (strain ATCC 11539 / FP-39264 / Madison 617) TaxID=670483 RepID=S7RGN5_GLOTA|nr:uncharacterized protein GLOTRDRAFT_111952 [Gloeophyllum trabeum ATCC 11539]EPQ53380.1 hypothetical protein GLOTRDRAFT_111952 [Gloeophyllum trabeum ATCC 11539]
MSALLRSSANLLRTSVAPQASQAATKRFASTQNRVYYEHTFPFDYSKRSFALKYALFCTTGFSIPFIAATYQIWKSGAGAAPQ